MGRASSGHCRDFRLQLADDFHRLRPLDLRFEGHRPAQGADRLRIGLFIPGLRGDLLQLIDRGLGQPLGNGLPDLLPRFVSRPRHTVRNSHPRGNEAWQASAEFGIAFSWQNRFMVAPDNAQIERYRPASCHAFEPVPRTPGHSFRHKKRRSAASSEGPPQKTRLEELEVDANPAHDAVVGELAEVHQPWRQTLW